METEIGNWREALEIGDFLSKNELFVDQKPIVIKKILLAKSE